MKTQTILLFFLAAQFLACQQPQPEAQAAEQSSTLREGLQEVFDQNQLMGMSVLIIANGARAWEGCFGLADSSRQIPVTPNTIYRIASISKSISTVALMQLAEQGKVDLHTDVSQYLGWPLKHPKFPETAISLQQLLNHTSGLRDGSGYSDFLGEMIDKQLDIKDLLLPEGTHYTEDMYADEAPGAFFSYTNCSWGVIASVIEKVSGERFDVYCRKHIFDPLGMQASFNVLDLKDLDQLAPLYRFKDGQWVAQVDDYKGAAPAPRVYEGYRLGHNGLIFGPQGSLRSSARDLATFAFMLMNKGQWQGTQILTEESVEQLTTSFSLSATASTIPPIVIPPTSSFRIGK